MEAAPKIPLSLRLDRSHGTQTGRMSYSVLAETGHGYTYSVARLKRTIAIPAPSRAVSQPMSWRTTTPIRPPIRATGSQKNELISAPAGLPPRGHSTNPDPATSR